MLIFLSQKENKHVYQKEYFKKQNQILELAIKNLNKQRNRKSLTKRVCSDNEIDSFLPELVEKNRNIELAFRTNRKEIKK